MLIVTGVVALAVTIPYALRERAARITIDGHLDRLCDPAAEVRSLAIAELHGLGASSIPRLIHAFRRVGAGPGSEPVVENDIPCDAGRFTVNLMACLRGMQSEGVVSFLVAALDDESNVVRYHAGNTLAFFGTDSVPALISALTGSRRERVRTSAAWVLSMIGPAAGAAVGPLTDALEDESKDVRYTARYALAQLSLGDTEYWRRIEHARESVGN